MTDLTNDQMEAAVYSVRNLIPDDAAIYGDNSDEYLFTDEQIVDAFQGVGHLSVLRTAGLLMIAVGNSEAMINKVIKTQDLSTNGALLQEGWLNSGKYYVDLANAEDQQYFQIVPGQGQWNPYERITGIELGDIGSYWGPADRFDQSW